METRFDVVLVVRCPKLKISVLRGILNVGSWIFFVYDLKNYPIFFVKYFRKRFSMVSSKPQHASLCWCLELFFDSGIKGDFPLVSLWSNATEITQLFKCLKLSIKFLIFLHRVFQVLRTFRRMGEFQIALPSLSGITLYLYRPTDLCPLLQAGIFNFAQLFGFVTEETCPIRNFSFSAVVIKSNYWVLIWKDKTVKIQRILLPFYTLEEVNSTPIITRSKFPLSLRIAEEMDNNCQTVKNSVFLNIVKVETFTTCLSTCLPSAKTMPLNIDSLKVCFSFHSHWSLLQ